MIAQETIDAVKIDVLGSLDFLKPKVETEFDPTWNIYMAAFTPEEVRDNKVSLGQRILADILRPIAQGPHNERLHLFYKDIVTEKDDMIYVDFLFKWA